MNTVFISYSRLDYVWAKNIRSWLLAKGCEAVFLDSHPHQGVKAGAKWTQALENAGEQARAVLPLISSSWLSSEPCWTEFEYARETQTPIFPILIDDLQIATLDQRLRGLQFCNIFSDIIEDREYVRLEAALIECGGLPSEPQQQTTTWHLGTASKALLAGGFVLAAAALSVFGFRLWGSNLIPADKAEGRISVVSPKPPQSDGDFCATGDISKTYNDLEMHTPLGERRRLQVSCLCNYIHRHPKRNMDFAEIHFPVLYFQMASEFKEKNSALATLTKQANLTFIMSEVCN